MDDKYSRYIFAEKEEEKKVLANELINEDADSFSDEQELENLLEQFHNPLDISSKAMATIHQLKNNKNENLSLNVLQTIKARKRKQVILWTVSAAAAVLVLSLVLMNLGGGSHFQIEVSSSSKNLKVINADGSREVKKDSQIEGLARINFPEGVIVSSSENAIYRFSGTSKEFLRLDQGEINLSVDSRVGKSPLFFNMPHGTVKVIGTSFILRCDNDKSELMVTEGNVEFVTRHGIFNVAAGETVSSDDLQESDLIVDSKTKIKLSFESLKEGLKYQGFPELVEGRFGKSLKLDGTSGAKVFRGLSQKEESISLWFKYEKNISKAQSILGQHDKAGSNNGFHIYLVKQKLFLQLKDHFESRDFSIDLPRDKWHHLVLCRSAKGPYSLYLNSKNVISGDFTYKYKNQNLNIGISPDTFWQAFEGLIDEVRIFDSLLTEKEVKNLYNQK